MKILSPEEKARFYHVNYAHRGLHDGNREIPENSLSAFQRATEKGYGVELDVQLSRDGQVMVFHDDSLLRMCGRDEKIWELDFEELRTLRLAGTDEQIPLFSEVLSVLSKGAGPLIVELKTGPRNEELCEKTLLLLRGYTRTFCIESFNPFIVDWFRKNAPEVVRGQLAAGVESYKAYPKVVARLLSKAGFSFINKPHFIAYDCTAPIPKQVEKYRKKGVLLVAWTVRESGQAEDFDARIFERFQPPLQY